MIFDVYVFDGDPVQALAAGATTGELVITSAGQSNGQVAYLYKPGSQETLLAPLRHVALVAMNSTGMVIEGVVIVSKRQTLKGRSESVKLPAPIASANARSASDSRKRTGSSSSVEGRPAPARVPPRGSFLG